MRLLSAALAIAVLGAGCSSQEQPGIDTAEETARGFIHAWQSGNSKELRGRASARNFATKTPIDDTAWRCRWTDTWTQDDGWFQCLRPWKGDQVLWLMVGAGSSEVYMAKATLPPENMEGFEKIDKAAGRP